MISDNSIRERILESLRGDPGIRASGIRVEVTEGNVRLSGMVSGYTAWKAAFIHAFETAGVVNIENDLLVSRLDRRDIPTDVELKKKIDKVLRKNDDADCSGVNIGVDDGCVALQGEVSSVWDMLRIEELASHVHGVAEVHNDLRIVTGEDSAQWRHFGVQWTKIDPVVSSVQDQLPAS